MRLRICRNAQKCKRDKLPARKMQGVDVGVGVSMRLQVGYKNLCTIISCIQRYALQLPPAKAAVIYDRFACFLFVVVASQEYISISSFFALTSLIRRWPH